MIGPADIGGVHIKYLHHCRRQLWLYARGFRPEHLSDPVQLGEAVHDTSYTRTSPVDLGAARLDFIDGQNWVHEVKSSAGATAADEAQAMHYCFRLKEIGIDARGGILHYPKVLRTCRQYLHRMQRSVFEGEVSTAQLKRFRAAIESVIDRSYDSVLIYTFPPGTKPEHDQWGSGEPAPTDIL